MEIKGSQNQWGLFICYSIILVSKWLLHPDQVVGPYVSAAPSSRSGQRSGGQFDESSTELSGSLSSPNIDSPTMAFGQPSFEGSAAGTGRPLNEGGITTKGVDARLVQLTMSSVFMPTLMPVLCGKDTDCHRMDGSYCDLESKMCRCLPELPITDSKNCYKASRYEEFCKIDLQCQKLDASTQCDKNLNVCMCSPRFMPKSPTQDGSIVCTAMVNSALDASEGSYVDLTLFGIMGGLALMFLIMCIVLNLFAKARFRGRSNRTIFNTPNPHLLNVSQVKDKERSSRSKSKGSRKSRYDKGSLSSASSIKGRSAGGGGNASSVSSRHRHRHRQASLKNRGQDPQAPARRDTTSAGRASPNERMKRASSSRARKSSVLGATASPQLLAHETAPIRSSVKTVKRTQSCRTNSRHWNPNNQRNNNSQHHNSPNYRHGQIEVCAEDVPGSLSSKGRSFGRRLSSTGPLGLPGQLQQISTIPECESIEPPFPTQRAATGREQRGSGVTP